MDPSVFYQVASCTGKDVETVFQEFNKKSGLYGVSGVSNDSRDVSAKAAEGDYRSQLALDLWGRRVADFIGQYYVRLGGCDLIIFSAGIGENDSGSRKLALTRIQEALGIEIDWKVNDETFGGKEAVLSTPNSKIKVVVIPTDEEVMIARDAYNICLK
jgi:acetate kinase